MNRVLFVFIFLLLPFTLSAQKVNLITVNQLEQRLASGKDTVYMVNFWATWCAPCISELPNFEQFSRTMKDKPVKVLLVSLDFKSKLKSVVQPFVMKMQLQNEVFLLDEKSQQAYIDKIDKNWSGAIPATLIVNPERQSRQMIEKELSYADILHVYKNNINDE